MPKLFTKTRLALFFAFFSFCLMPAPAAAGGGPENVLLVVNPKSPDSLTIANYYIHLRQIPAGNVLYLPWDPKADQASIDDFRSQILIRSSRQFIRAGCPRKSITSSIRAIFLGQLILPATFKSSRIPHPFPRIPTRTIFNNRCRVIGLCPSRLRPSVPSTASPIFGNRSSRAKRII